MTLPQLNGMSIFQLPEMTAGNQDNNDESRKDDIEAFVGRLGQVINGEIDVTAEPAWLERVEQIAQYLPREQLDALLHRLDHAKGIDFTDVQGFATSHNLTEAEEKLLSSLASGLSVPEHAKKMDISVNTGRVHMQNILNKTGAAGQLDLMRMLHIR